MPVEATLLTPDLVTGHSYEATFRQRAKLLDLLRINTLVEVKLTNQTARPVTLQPGTLTLLDNQIGRQYDVLSTVDLQGPMSQHIIPGAINRSVLVYPKLREGPKTVSLFSDTSADVIGTFTMSGAQ